MIDLMIKLERGDDYELVVRWFDGDRQPVMVADSRLQMRSGADGNLLLELTPASGQVINGNEIVSTITPVQSATLRTGVWDLEATATSGRKKTLVGGRLRVRRDVSHA